MNKSNLNKLPLSVFFHPRLTVRMVLDNWSSKKIFWLIYFAGFSNVFLILSRKARLFAINFSGQFLLTLSLSIFFGLILGLILYYGVAWLLVVTSRQQDGTCAVKEIRAVLVTAFLPVIYAFVFLIAEFLLRDIRSFLIDNLVVKLNFLFLYKIIHYVFLVSEKIIHIFPLIIGYWFPIALVIGISEINKISIWKSVKACLVTFFVIFVALMLYVQAMLYIR